MWVLLSLVSMLHLALCSVKHALQAPPGFAYDLETNYNVRFDESDAKLGGCQEWESRIKQSYKDALELVDTAREALEDLRKPEPPPSAPRTEQDQWSRKSGPYVTMFDQKPHSDSPDSVEGLAKRANDVLSKFNGWLSDHWAAHDSQPSNWILCGDEFLHWESPEAPDPDWKGDPSNVPTIGQDKDCRNGAFVAQSLPPEHRKFCSPRFDGPKRHPICTYLTAAETFYDNKVIVLCPRQLEEKRWDIRKEVQRIRKRKHISKYDKSIAVTLVHEWGHLFNNFDDQDAVNKHGTTFKDRKQFWRKEALAYGWALSHFLARYKYKDNLFDRTHGVPNPDNYAYFALAMYFDKWWWESGNALPEN